MTTNASTRCLTPEEFIRLLGSKHCELVAGVPVERDKGNRAAWFGAQLTFALADHVWRHQLGWVFGATAGFVMSPRLPNTLRRPSGSYVANSKMTKNGPSETYDRIAPDLAIECLGARDTIQDMVDRSQEYISAGVKMVWLIEPFDRCVRVLRMGKREARVRVHEQLKGYDVVPGFCYQLVDLSTFFKPDISQ